MSGLSRWSGALIVLPLLLSSLLVTGTTNGDVAVYLHQVSQDDFAQRTVHLGYLALIQLIHWGAQGHELMVLNIVNSICAIVICGAVMTRLGARTWVAGVLVLCAVLPLALGQRSTSCGWRWR